MERAEAVRGRWWSDDCRWGQHLLLAAAVIAAVAFVWCPHWWWRERRRGDYGFIGCGVADALRSFLRPMQPAKALEALSSLDSQRLGGRWRAGYLELPRGRQRKLSPAAVGATAALLLLSQVWGEYPSWKMNNTAVMTVPTTIQSHLKLACRYNMTNSACLSLSFNQSRNNPKQSSKSK